MHTDKQGARGRQLNTDEDGWVGSLLSFVQETQPSALSLSFPRLSPLPAHVPPGFSLHVPQGTLPSGTSRHLLSSCRGVEVLASLDGLCELTVPGEQSDL